MLNKCVGLLLPMVLTCAGTDIVKNGRSCAEIVISQNADAGVRLAAKDLQKHLHLISGARLKIVTPENVKAASLLCVGESAATRKAGYKSPAFKTSGYDIWVKGNCVVLNGPVTLQKKNAVAGTLHPVSRYRTLLSDETNNTELGVSLADDCGPMHAVSAFLEHLGVRFYAPYKEGTVIPKLKDIRVGDFRETREAAFARREFLMADIQETDNEAVLWFKRLKTGSSLAPVGVLALADVIRAGEKAHPEWTAYNRLGEKLLTSDGCVFPRFAQKSLQKAAAEAAGKFFDAHPGIEKLLIVPPALRGVSDFKDSEKFNTRDRYPLPAACNALFSFYIGVAGEIAKSHPGKKIIWQGFYNMNLPDAPKTFPANIEAAPYAISPLNDNLRQLLPMAKFFKVNNFQQREWWNEYSVPQPAFQPWFFARKLQEKRQVQKEVVSGFLMDAAVDRTARRLAQVPLTHFMYYVNCKLLWNPDLDLHALTDEFCRLWYGPAADEMKTLMTFAENVIFKKGRSLSSQNPSWGPEEIAVLFELFEKAERKTQPGTLYRKRVAALKKSLAGLKSVCGKLVPAGKPLTAEILPWNTPCDLKLGKYKKWYVLPGTGKELRTEYAVAFSEQRRRLFIALRCYEPEMKKLRAPAKTLDDCAVFMGDHIRIDFNTPDKSFYVVAADSKGLFFDGSTDSQELAVTGCISGRDREQSAASVKRYADRWELELAIDVAGCGGAPDWNPPWGLNVTRVRTVSGKRQEFSLAKNAADQPVKWYQLTAPRVDSRGRATHKRNGVPLRLDPNVPAETVYTVKRAKTKVDLSEAWDGKCWGDVPEIRLLWESWSFGRSSGVRPDARAKIQYDDKFIYVLYQVKDNNVRAVFTEDQQSVCLDSCMELFVRPAGKGAYYNFEANCIGTLLLYEIKVEGKRNIMSPVAAEELKAVKRFSTLPRSFRGEKAGPITWRLGLQIPIEFFVKRAGIEPELSGQIWTANVYRCADWSKTPAWLLWKNSCTFHCPEEFGTFIFE